MEFFLYIIFVVIWVFSFMVVIFIHDMLVSHCLFGGYKKTYHLLIRLYNKSAQEEARQTYQRLNEDFTE